MLEPGSNDMESQSFDNMVQEIRTNNREALESEFEAMPELINKRPFPRELVRTSEDGPDWFSPRFTDYWEFDGENEFVCKKPDPWKISEGEPDHFLADREDLMESLELGKMWMNFLKLPPTTLLMIRSLLNMIIDSIECLGPQTPIGVTRSFSDFIVKNFPDDIPRTNTDPPIPDIDDELVNMMNLIEIYNLQFKNGLKTRKNFINYNRWAGRRDNFDNWCKFASNMKDLAAELGPFSHNLINTVNDKIDGILAHQLLNTDTNVLNINEYNTCAKDWVRNMFRIPAVIKILKGKPTVVKRYVPAPRELVLRHIMPEIMEREVQEHREFNQDNMEAASMTLSLHEVDSGNVSGLP
jgi:hypothetical protein